MIKKVLRCIDCLMAIFLVLCALSVVYQKVVKREADASLFGFRAYIVLSGSMEPVLQPGDLIVSRRAAEDQIDVGDIITFLDEDGVTVTHRVVDYMVKDGQKLYQTKGDHNNANDIGLVSIEAVKGKYVFKISGLGKIVARIASPAGLLLILAAVAAGYFIAGKNSGGKSRDT